jgi:hypothetical protein
MIVKEGGTVDGKATNHVLLTAVFHEILLMFTLWPTAPLHLNQCWNFELFIRENSAKSTKDMWLLEAIQGGTCADIPGTPLMELVTKIHQTIQKAINRGKRLWKQVSNGQKAVIHSHWWWALSHCMGTNK